MHGFEELFCAVFAVECAVFACYGYGGELCWCGLVVGCFVVGEAWCVEVDFFRFWDKYT